MARPSSERDRLTQLIQQWNVDHYDLFELSAPNQDLEFHGVVRFYFQGGEGANVITKCIRVSSTATTRDVIDTLIEKFRPDMRMLTQNKYALYEVHENGEERRLGDEEKLLWVQLNWGKDVREGRFLLKNEDEKTSSALGFRDSSKDENPNFKRKLSKREKKEKKKRDIEMAKQNESVSKKLYNEAPETSFTRSISNPEAVMRRRRQQKLEKKLAQMQSREGGNDSGGTLKIYGESLQPDVPYKTLLLSTADTTNAVIKEAMEKYGLEKQDPEQFCLVEVLLPSGNQEYHGGNMGEERILDEGECPLAIVMQHPKHKGNIIFQLRRRPGDYKPRKLRPRAVSHDDLRKAHDHPATQADKLPFLMELNPRDGRPQKHLLPLNVTEVVRDKPMTPGNQCLQLSGPDIFPRHCVIAHTEGIVTVTPTTRDAEIFVENRPVKETTMLRHGMTIQFGRNHLYRFVDPRFEEFSKQGHPVPAPRNIPPQETNFDVDGHVETVTQPLAHAQARPVLREMPQDGAPPNTHMSSNGHDRQTNQLPAALDYRLDAEDRLLQAVILEVNSRAVQFKLAPTYTLYMAIRRLLLARFQMGMPPAQHSQMVVDFVRKTSKFIQQAIQEHHNDPTALAFWMANASEVLHFFKQDVDVQPYGADSQELLAEAVQMAFHHLVRCLQGDLQRVMPAFLDPSDVVDDENAQDQYNHGRPFLADVLNTLSAAMTLLRRCRVNAALTIQLFSQLFHFINMWLFNILVMEPRLQLCTRTWGLRLKRRLFQVEKWAEKQGLELAADCHLCRIIQAAHLLQTPKATSEDITNISSACFKLNSLQLRALLTSYIPDPSEPPISHSFVERVVAIAENMADELTRTDGREVRLEEDPDLHLPFLLPEDGYSCDTIRGIPNGLPEFVLQLGNTGICQMVANNKASGSWTVYMSSQQQPLDHLHSPHSNHPEILTVSFKKVKGSMGLSIVAAVGEGLTERGIYIKSVVPGGAAALDGRLKAGDQLLEVDGRSLVGLSQDKAAEQMVKTGDIVTLKVAKQGAIYHGLATLLNEPSPNMQRHPMKGGPVGQGEEAPPPYIDPRQNSPNDPSQSRPVPQPRGQNQSQRESMRSSASNLTQPQYSSTHPQDPSSYNRWEVDHRSKSTSNLHVDTSFERNDPQVRLRGAASVSTIPPAGPGYPQYSPAVHRPDIRPNDYENQPQMNPVSGHGGYNQDLNQNIKPVGMGPNVSLHPANHRPSDRSSVSSKASSSSNRDLRPQSAYYSTQQAPRDDYNNYGGRPKSDEVTSNKLKEWQDKYEPQNQGYRSKDQTNSPQFANGNAVYKGPENSVQNPPLISHSQKNTRGTEGNQVPGFSNQNQSFKGSDAANHSPPYINIGASSHSRPLQQAQEPRPSARDRLFGNQAGTGSSALKVPQTSQQKQVNFYENTQTGGDAVPPFHQRPPSESDGKPKPAVMPKPSVVKKPQPKIQPTEVPFKTVDKQQTQPDFYGNSMRPNPTQPLQGGLQQYQAGYPEPRPGHQVDRQDPRYMQPETQSGYPMQKFPSHHGALGPFGYQTTQPILPRDVPPDLPPPPEEQEELPPLPPPPQDFYDQDEQQRMAEPIPPPTNLPISYDRYGQSGSYNGQGINPQASERESQSSQNRLQPAGFQPHMLNQPPKQIMTPNYQNVNFMQEVAADSGPVGLVPASTSTVPPPLEHNVYESYISQNNPHQQQRQQQQPPVQQHTTGPKPSSLYQAHQQVTPSQSQPPTQPSGSRNKNSAWDRDEMEKAEEQLAEERFRALELEIEKLESRSYLSIQEQDRLRKLKLEYEFQRRVKEVGEKGDYDADIDDEMMERMFTRERLIQSLKDDLEKSRQKILDLDHRQMLLDAQREKERMQKLERRLEMMEKDRQEVHDRMEKRQQRRAKDHKEQLQQQREVREKQKQNFEEQKRLMMLEEEKVRQRREEEINKRRQMERERQQEIQKARDEELRLQEDTRRWNDNYITPQMLQQQQERVLQPVRALNIGNDQQTVPLSAGVPSSVTGSHMNNGFNGNLKNNSMGLGYPQYMNLPPAQQQVPERENMAPPPPTRKSSYNTAAATRNHLDYTNLASHSGQPTEQEQTLSSYTKKSVSFNTNMNTYQDRTPSHSFSSEHNISSSVEHLPPGPNDVFHSPPQTSYHSPNIVRQDSASGIIGANEWYPDPQERIGAQKAAQLSRKPAVERMSFRDKMKYFAQEAGEDTPKDKPKASRTLRNIESQLNGQ